MRIGAVVFLFAVTCAFSSARADVIVSGSVSTTNQQGVSCSQSSTAGSFDLSCDDSVSSATAQASVSELSGSGSIYALGPLYAYPYAYAQADIQLNVNAVFELTGGTGTTLFSASASATAPPFGAQSASCTIAIDGIWQFCAVNGLTFSQTVTYNVPFTVELSIDIAADSYDGDPGDAQFAYNFYQSGLETATIPTPEPSSIFLLMPGLAGALFAGRSRVNRLCGR
jgi:hypothetical protein